MRVHFYHESEPWDWQQPVTLQHRHLIEMARLWSRWGHEVEVFTNLKPESPSWPQDSNIRWRTLDKVNAAVPDEWVIYADHDPLVTLRHTTQVRHIISPDGLAEFDAEKMGRLVAVWNAGLYNTIGGTTVDRFRGHLYRHPVHFIYSHPWEIESRRRWLRVAAGDVFLDIGSSIGSWALPAAACGAAVFAFDPGTDAGCLRRLARENGFKNLKVDGRFVAGTSGKPVARKDIPWSSVPVEGQFDDTITLAIDDFVRDRKLQRVDFIKVDTDGGELGVLAGMTETLTRFKPAIVVETHTFLGISVAEVCEALAGLNYKTEVLDMEDGYYNHVYGTPKA